jgi:hypothetical protein
MINPTVETDLVGEMIEITEDRGKYIKVLGKGRCRAITAATGGWLVFWLEVLEQFDVFKPGDLIFCNSQGNQGYGVTIRIIKS